jgi:hypothetical protein
MESAVASMSADEAAAWLAQSSSVTSAGGQRAQQAARAIDAAPAVAEEGWVERRPRRYLSELVAPPKDDDANMTTAAASGGAATHRGRGRRGAVVHVIIRCVSLPTPPHARRLRRRLLHALTSWDACIFRAV